MTDDHMTPEKILHDFQNIICSQWLKMSEKLMLYTLLLLTFLLIIFFWNDCDFFCPMMCSAFYNLLHDSKDISYKLEAPQNYAWNYYR